MRSHLTHGVGAKLLLAATLSTAAAKGAPGAALSLRWNDPDGLAATTAQEFAARLSERLGHPAFNAEVTERTLSVNWRGPADQCQVELLLVERGEIEGTREIQSPNGECRALVPALLTVAAMLLEAQPPEPAPSAPSAPPSPRPQPPPLPPPIHPSEARAGSRAAALISLGAALTSGLAPKPQLGPTAELAWAPLPQLRLGAEGAWFLKQKQGGSPGLSIEHRRAGLFACGMPLHGRLALGVCASSALRFFTAEGVSLPYPRSRDATTVTLGGALRGEWRLASHWCLVGQAGAEVATRRLYFYYKSPAGSETTLFRQQRLTPQLLLGLSLELP